MQQGRGQVAQNDPHALEIKVHGKLLSLWAGWRSYVPPARRSPDPPSKISRARINRLRLIPIAGEYPSAVITNTWLASSAPSPAGSGMRNETNMDVSAASVCQKSRCTSKKVSISPYSTSIIIHDSRDTASGPSNPLEFRLVNDPAICSATMSKRMNLICSKRDGVARSSAESGYFPL